MGEWFAASLSNYTLSSQYSLPGVNRDFNYLSTFKQSELSTCSSELSANVIALVVRRGTNVQKFMERTNDEGRKEDRKATQPRLPQGHVSGRV